MKARVPLFRTSPARSVLVDTEATNGATIGENVYNADGTLFDPAQVSVAPSDTGGEGSGISLDDVGVTGDGLVTVAGFLAEGGVKIGADLARSWVFG